MDGRSQKSVEVAQPVSYRRIRLCIRLKTTICSRNSREKMFTISEGDNVHGCLGSSLFPKNVHKCNVNEFQGKSCARFPREIMFIFQGDTVHDLLGREYSQIHRESIFRFPGNIMFINSREIMFNNSSVESIHEFLLRLNIG